ncbi:MAG TPA: histidine phosphatase family protein [Roseiarcus sp.]|nr:histidine phosphatase family protein [Roseiarcus sp.]
MLRLLLLRHAKAAPQDPAHDRQRGLIERGRSDAARVAGYIAAQKRPVDAIIHSGARRAEETAMIVSRELPKGLPILIEPRLYEATASQFLTALRALGDEHACPLVVGHNPSLGEVAIRLAGAGDRSTRERMAAKFSTSGLAILDFEAKHWADIREGGGRLVAFVTPAGLADD